MVEYMNKITFEQFTHVMSFDINKQNACIEANFCLDDCLSYQDSWLGKLADSETGKDIYWFGLADDGSQAYSFESFEKFVDAKVFDGKTIKEIWDLISFFFIDTFGSYRQ